jgi:hypothetical protein
MQDDTSSRSSCGVSYQRLEELLAAGRWQEADEETRSLLLGIVNRQNLWLREEDIKQLPCLDLQSCDNLWVKYSQGRFGFSVQTRVLAENTRDLPINDVGWEETGEGKSVWPYCYDNIRSQSRIPFDLTAPEGFLPLTFEMGGSKVRSCPYTRDTESDMGFYSIAGHRDEWSWDSCFGSRMVRSFLDHFCQCNESFSEP